MTAASRTTASVTIDLEDPAVAQLVHDLRNELTVILACVDDLAGFAASGQDQRVIALQRCAARALLLTRQLLTAEGVLSTARRPLDLNHVVVGAVETLSRVIGNRIRLRLRLSAEPVPVIAERLELERILLNLALNARDAMAGDGELTIETAVVGDSSSGRMDSRHLRLSARLTVSDTGCGLTPEVKGRMFEPFFTTKEAGTGLGLSAVACTVRQLGGSVSVESQPGRGT